MNHQSDGITILDKTLGFLLILLALSLSTTRGGINTIVALADLLLIIIYLKSPFTSRALSSINKAMAIFFVVMAVVSLFSQDIIRSYTGIFRWVIVFLPFYFTFYALRKNQISADLVIFVIAISTLIGSSITVWNGLRGIEAYGTGRVGGLLGVMEFAGILGLVIPMFLVQSLEQHDRSTYWRWFFGLVFGMAIVALLYNGTRGVWISTFSTVGIYLAINHWRNRTVLIIAGICMVVLGFFVASHPKILERILLIADTTRYSSNTERLLMWQYGWSTFLAHPLFGLGINTLHSFSFTPDNKIILGSYLDYIHPTHVHNTYLQVLAETGLAGLSVFGGLFVTIVAAAWRGIKRAESRRYSWIVLLATLHLLVHGLTDYTFSPSIEFPAYWFIVGLAFTGLVSDKDPVAKT